MSRGGSYGGGQSSLGYLFGSDNQQPGDPPVSPSTFHQLPPYGIDLTPDNPSNPPPPPPPPPPAEKQSGSTPNNYQRSQGQNTGNFITDRPSTKVRSVPGGDSSLGYLFGDK